MEISDFFYIVMFLSVIGSLACILLLFIEKMTQLGLPFPIYLLIVFFYAIPLTMPDAVLIYHEPMRIEAFKTAALVWIIGFGISAAFMVIKIYAAHRTINDYVGCSTERVLTVYDECLRKVKFKRIPPILFGKIKEPACVIHSWRSYVVLQEEVTRELTDIELRTVLTHELLHIKRKHTILKRIFDFVCCMHWFNPIVWIGRRELSSACEIDCDRSVLKVFEGQLQAAAYAKVMVRLMELAVHKKKSLRGTSSRGTLGALDFWTAKYRIFNLLNKSSTLHRAFALFSCAAALCVTAWLSADFSRSYFYPFGSTSSGTEWRETR